MKVNQKSFTGSEIKQGVLFDLSDNTFPCIVHGFVSRAVILQNSTSTTYGYVYAGTCTIKYNDMTFVLKSGMYFSVPGSFKVEGGEGILIEYLNFKGFFQVAGSIEATGRLNYIDGCKDSLLINPIKKGNPCLNILYFPHNITQSPHTHPSYRIGVIVDGNGVCVTPNEKIALKGGLAFIIHENGVHSFNTPKEGMRVIAFHPDSDFGPEDENHPMINRTIIDGISANKLTQLHTKTEE